MTTKVQSVEPESLGIELETKGADRPKKSEIEE